MWDDITKCLSILCRYAEYRKNVNSKNKLEKFYLKTCIE